MSDNSEGLDARINTLRATFLRGSPFREDRVAAEELMTEASPVLESLLAPGEHPEGRTHEALAMVALLGRRAAGLGVTPSAMHALFRGLAEQASAENGVPALEIISLGIEGYVAERDELAQRRSRELAQRAVPIVELVPTVFALFLHGHHEAEEIAAINDALGKRMLHGAARSLLVDATGFENPTREIASEIFAADATALMIGTPCVFAVTPRLVELLPEVASAHERVKVETSTRVGLRRTLGLAGYAMRDFSAWPPLFRKLLDESP